MPEEKRNEFAKMLKYYLMMNNKTQSDMVTDLKYDKSTVSGWCSGIRVPKVDTIIEIANYLHVNVGDLILQDDSQQSYYFDNETAKMAQELKDNKELKLLFDASRDASPEDLKQTADYLMFLKKKERGE